MNPRRSASVGALPREKKHFVSRTESSSGASLDVRCACQYFQCDSLLPERINPAGDSRPTSAMGFHSDLGSDHHEHLHSPNHFQGIHLDSMAQMDQLSTRSYQIGGHPPHMDIDRFSMGSIGGQRTLDDSTPQVDVSFVEKYPELEEVARSRGLVVRSISDAKENEMGPPASFMAGQRRRQMSLSRMSSGGMRDPDAWSTRSVTSLRRISRSPSKSDLFVADINIPTKRPERYEMRSASTSRRTSNVDLSHFASHRGPPALALSMADSSPVIPLGSPPPLRDQGQQLAAPKVNLIAPTPATDAADMRPDFERATASRQRSPSPVATDYRVAKPPVSTDYMRPEENKENVRYVDFGQLMPQNRPIDVSQFSSYSDEKIQEVSPQLTTKTAGGWRPFARATSPKPTIAAPSTITKKDPLLQEVAELENIAANRNIEDVNDNIRLQTTPPPLPSGDITHPSTLHPVEATNIQIISKVPAVDVDQLVQSETRKAIEARLRSKSPSPIRPQSPHAMDTLQLPGTVVTGSLSLGVLGKQQALKRQRSPERNMSPDRSKKAVPSVQKMDAQTIEMHFSDMSNEIPLQDVPPEVKSSYTSRFKSMFTSNKSATPPGEPPSTPDRRRSPSPARGRSPTPQREKSPSPIPTKLMGMFSKSKPTPMSISTGTSAVVTKASEKEPMSVKVRETFSLKVDEMDQYNARPSKPPPSSVQPTPPITAYSSREDFSTIEQSSISIADAFAPVVVPALSREQFMAGNRRFYSSEMDSQSRRSESEFNRASKEPSVGSGSVSHFHIPKGTLISVPIHIGSSSVSGDLSQRTSSVGASQYTVSRPPSADGRIGMSKLVRKPSFNDGRTQSQDRARKLHGSHEDLYSGRMTKTVSFNFDERKSRLSDFESSNLSNQHKENREFLERTYFARDHEYEPIASPSDSGNASAPSEQLNLSRNIAMLHEEIRDAEDLQQDLEERYLSSEATTPRTESRTDYEIHTSQVDSSALEELPLKPENRKKGFMASAQDRTRKMQAGIKTQAGRIKTKLRTPAKKPASSSPKAKERKRFKAPEFSKIKMPEIKRPDMSKLKDFKRPEFTKFNKPDMSKFKLPDKFSTLKLRRSKSFKENEGQDEEMEADTGNAAQPQQQKRMFDFNFGTYPRAFRKKKPVESQASLGTETATEGVSVIPSTETQPSLESSSSPQGDRGPGPVRSRWADKFSDVSYNDSEGSRYRRYGSEQESFDRESSLERRMKDDLEETGSEQQELGIMGGVADTKQFAEFDEENRAIHEISKMRAGEFRRRPIVHQDSDLRSEDSKEVEGWTEKEIEKNKLLRKAELEAEASYLKYPLEDGLPQETQSTSSSGKKVVMEEIDDDEFFLRKRGVSEDNIELRQYISNAIREGYDRPINTLDHVGQHSERMEYRDYDIPPPKPKRLHKSYGPQDISQDLESQRSEYGDELSLSQNGSDFYSAPKRPLRKGRSRSKYSMDSQDFPVAENLRHEPYFDDDEEYLRPPRNSYKDNEEAEMNDLNIVGKQVFPGEPKGVNEGAPAPQAPRRRKRDTRDNSMDKDSYINGFGGRSVSNSRLQPTEDVIVYRTEHEYPISLASPEKLASTLEDRKSRPISRYDEDDRTSRGAESLGFDEQGESQADQRSSDGKDKYIIDMMENDGYAIVRKEHLPKPTPPARRKKFSRSPGERFTTIASAGAGKSGTPPPPERPPPPRAYTPSTMEEEPVPPRRRSTASVDIAAASQILDDDYEEPEALQQERPESPRDLQSGEIINKMKFRPLPPPPRPPREKRQRAESKSSAHSAFNALYNREIADEQIATSSTAESYDPTDVDLEEEETRLPEVEVSTQTDPLPDDFECEEFEITEDMRIIEPRINSMRKTLDELLREEELKAKEAEEATPQLTEEEQLARGLQRFRDANQRSISERSRASSQADHSKSQSRPQTPSAVVIERRVSTPIPSQQSESMLEASLIVRPIDDLDLEEEALRREGLLTDSSQQSKSDVEATSHDEEESKLAVSEYSRGPSSEELNAALDELRAQGGSSNYGEDKGESVEGELNDYDYDEKMSDIDIPAYDYTNYLGEETSEKDNKEEKSVRNEYLSETEEIEAPLSASEDDQRREIKDEISVAPPSASEDEQKSEIRDELRVEESTEEQKNESQEIGEDLQSPRDEALEAVRMDHTREVEIVEEPPLPPPRRKSTTLDIPPALTLVEELSKELTPVPSSTAAVPIPTQPELPAHIGDLEVERLRVHALHAGQIMVSQLHGTQISAEELECKSGNLIVKNIALPEGFIEDIVERVRTTDRQHLLTAETQTSLQASSEALATEDRSPLREIVPPPKPPRQRDLEAAKRTVDTSEEIVLQQLRNYDEETQTDPVSFSANANIPPPPPPVYTTTEYLQSLPPIGFYNLRRGDEQPYGSSADGNEVAQHRRHHHHHRHHRRCDSSCSECEDYDELAEREETRSRSHSRRSRSSTRPPVEPQTVAKAGKQFVSACSLSIVQMINRLTAAIRGGDPDKNVQAQVHHIPTLVALFVVISFTLIVYMLSGRNVHTHHWDFFNPPGSGPRQS
ncbi:PREDICTED: uncharacterized protein LOC108365888 [Rhagoletis zephyria]|uniref:uncharacterized protein LOC108365888 n=1 Tax=Rhagoletis zephyria TaxID=28612 RepID=UPI0008119159|nr:PREDICTED: uncharacterized protein LOC108365888 [Rhagoletis zephyria]